MGAIGTGSGVKTANAAPGDVCNIEGPTEIQEGSTHFYAARKEDADDDVYFDIDDETGDSDVTSYVEEDGDEDLEIDPGVNTTPDIDVQFPGEIGPDDFADLTASGDITIPPNPCGTSDEADQAAFEAAVDAAVRDDLADCLDGQTTTDCDGSSQWTGNDTDSGGLDDAGGDGITPEEIADQIITSIIGGASCDSMSLVIEDWLLSQGVTDNGGNDAEVISDDIEDLCNEFNWDDIDSDFGDTADGVAIIDITCEEAGHFELTAFDANDEANSFTIEVDCVGAPNKATLTASPPTVEIVPALGNVSHSLLVVTFTDEDGNPIIPDPDPLDDNNGDGVVNASDGSVDWKTDRCTVDGLTAADYAAINGAWLAVRSNNPETHVNFDNVANANSAHAPLNNPSSPVFVSDPPGPAGPFSIAAAVLHCDSTAVTPGIATVTAELDRTGSDLVATTTVTVVGPPAAITVTTDKANVACGERVTVTAKITDAVGQNVSEHTLAESFSNNGGTMGGTGAIAGFAAPITPFSSTVGETFSGVVTFYLITSDVHDGTYSIVVTSGGSGAVGALFEGSDIFAGGLGGWFSTAPVSGFATVTCGAAPAVTGPSTGTGPLRAPNTGDAGLADSSSSWMLLGIAGAVAFALAGLTTVKVTRR
jgi:hypothetical protein